MSIVACIIDQREPAWVQALTFGGAMTACSLLDAGDLLATTDDGTLLAIERKEPSDFLNSLRDDRLWPQLAGIRAASKWAYLLITGELRRGDDGKTWADGRGTGWAWNAVQGALLQAQEMGVMVAYAANNADYEPAVLRLAARSHKPEILLPPARDPRVMSQAEQILCSLPGIGYERVGALLEYTGSPAWALSFLTDLSAEAKVPGIGPGVKRAIRKALGFEHDDMILSPIVVDNQLQEA